MICLRNPSMAIIVILCWINETSNNSLNYGIIFVDFKPEFGGDWPLTEKEISIIDANHTTLINLLEPCELTYLLFATDVINSRQKDSIASKLTNHEKNEVLLDILTRRSLFDYHKTISCLHASNQSHIAQILDEGGGEFNILRELHYCASYKSIEFNVTVDL